MKYHFRVDEKEGDFFAECIELKWCFAQAPDWKQLRKKLEGTVNDCLEKRLLQSDTLVPLPQKELDDRVELASVPVDPKIAFSILLRHCREGRAMTRKAVMEKMGFLNSNSYSRLEKKCNAGLSLIAKVREVFPEFPVDRVFS